MSTMAPAARLKHSSYIVQKKLLCNGLCKIETYARKKQFPGFWRGRDLYQAQGLVYSVERGGIYIYILYKHLIKQCLELQKYWFRHVVSSKHRNTYNNKPFHIWKMCASVRRNLTEKHNFFVLELTKVHFGPNKSSSPKLPNLKNEPNIFVQTSRSYVNKYQYLPKIRGRKFQKEST